MLNWLKLIFLPSLAGAFSVGFAILPGMLVMAAFKPSHMGVLGSNPFTAIFSMVAGAPFLSLMGMMISLPVCIVAQLIIGLPLCARFNSRLSRGTYALVGYLFAIPISVLVVLAMNSSSRSGHETLEVFVFTLSLSLVGAIQAITTYGYALKIQQNKILPKTTNQ